MSSTDIQRLVYSPKAWVFTKNVDGEILDLTEFVVAGEIRRLINQVSTAEIKLRNPEMRFTTHGDHHAAFHPMDPITIYLERIVGYPVQVFTGYLDTTPYLQLFPGTITLKASCTLKRLLHNHFQIAQQYTLNFFHHFGWNPSGAGVLGPTMGIENQSPTEERNNKKWQKEEKEGKLKNGEAKKKEEAQKKEAKKSEKEFDEFEQEGKKKATGAVPFSAFPGAKTGNDGSFSKIVWALLYYVADWKDENIYIEAMPPTVPELITTLWTEFEKSENKAAKAELEAFWSALIGTAAIGSGGAGAEASLGEPKDTKTIVQKMAQVANEEGVSAAFVINTAYNECTFKPQEWEEGKEYSTGWFQFNFHSRRDEGGAKSTPYSHVNKSYTVAEARDIGIATAAFCKQAKALGIKQEPEWEEWATAIQISIGYSHWNETLPTIKKWISQYVHDGQPTPGGVLTEAEEKEQKEHGKHKKSGAGTEEGFKQYRNPFEKASGIKPSRCDMGADYTSAKSGETIVAIADSTYLTSIPGWPLGTPKKAFIFQITQGGPLRGQFIYYAESLELDSDILSGKRKKVKRGEKIATTTSTVSSTGLEFGYCDSSGTPLAAPEWTQQGNEGIEDAKRHPTKIGLMFARLMKQLGGYTPTNGDPGNGILYPGGKHEIVEGGTAASSGNEGEISTAATAASFLSPIQYPKAEELAEAQIIGGQKSLLNTVPVMNMVQQVCEASLRSFQSLPNGDFYAFYPDYFGEFGQHEPYWAIHNIEILSGEIELSDENLATHVFTIGNTTWPADLPIVNEINAGVMTIFEAFTPGLLFGKDAPKSTPLQREAEAIKFLQRYGARPLKYESPTVYSTLFESLLSYQQFLLSWSRQFKSTFTFTFMPELFPGGKVAFPEHGIQMYIESVTHSWDLEGGFRTICELQAPSVYKDKDNSAAVAELPENMVEALLEPQRKQVAPQPTAPKQRPALPQKKKAKK